MVQSKYIWATDLAQFDINDEALENFITFDTFNEALQDAFHHLYGIDDDATIYIAELTYDDYLFEIGKRDGVIYPHIINIYQYADERIWKLT